MYHSFVWQYLPEDTQARITAHMRKMGERATERSPLAWLTMEERERDDPQRKTTTGARRGRHPHSAWPGGRPITVAECHPHCRWINVLNVSPIPTRPVHSSSE